MPDWKSIEKDVIEKLNLLRIAWESTENGEDTQLHSKLVDDVYIPIIKLLGEFCACVEEQEEKSKS